MKKNIWILNHYAGEMLINEGGRHYWLAKYLRRQDYNPVIFCANSMHGKHRNIVNISEKKICIKKTAKDIGVPFILVRTRLYSGNDLNRVLNMVDFYRNVQRVCKSYAKKNGKPDIIYASSVHPLTLVAGIHLAKKYHVKCICEIRDLWPETLIAYGMMNQYNLVITLLRYIEKWCYTKADSLIFTMEGGYDYIKERKWENTISKLKVHYINNGIDLEVFENNKIKYQIKDSDLQNSNLFKVIYVGSIRKANNLGLLLDVAKKIYDPKIKFLIWGDGDEIEELKARIKLENICNIVFKGRVEKKFIPYITSMADLNIIHGEASPIMRFGMSLNKMFDYIASGNLILTDFPSKYNPSVQYGCGIEVASMNSSLPIAKEIERISNLSEEILDKYRKNANKAALEFDFKRHTEKLVDIIEEI